MEHASYCVSTCSRKRRKSPEDDKLMIRLSMDELNDDLVEQVLSWLPTSTLVRLGSVCKRWKSAAGSASFKLACSHIPSRDPWFFMVDLHQKKSIIFDSSDGRWRKLNQPLLLQSNCNENVVPVAASGGLVCFRKISGNYIVCNPVTGACRELPPLDSVFISQSLHAIALHVYSNHHCSYKLVLVSGELPKLSFRVYNSEMECWEDDSPLMGKSDDCLELDLNDESTVYFLSKAGNVVSTNMQRSPSKQYSSVITSKDGEEIVYFLSSLGTVVACNLSNKSFLEYPRLLPVFCEHSIDLVECRGEMFVVLLSEFLETASLRVWKFDEKAKSWQHVAVMPPSMSHDFFGKKADINCVGAGSRIFICLSSMELCCYILCDLLTNEWVEVPKCNAGGEAFEFMSALSFEPRIEACV